MNHLPTRNLVIEYTINHTSCPLTSITKLTVIWNVQELINK